jgi:drug/metabolite transporter (DMT)-like permease
MSTAEERLQAPAPLLAWASLVVVWFVWGSTYLGIRVAVETIPPFLMAGVRYVIAGTLLYAILRVAARSSYKPLSRSELKRTAISGLLLLVGGNGLLCFAEQRVPSGIAALIVATVPIWMIVIDALITKKRISAWSTAGLILGTIGVAALVGAPSSAIPLGYAAIILFASLSWAVGSLYSHHNAEEELNPVAPAVEMFIGGLGQIAVALCIGEFRNFHLAGVSVPSIWGFLWLITAGAMLGYTAYAYAVRTLPARITATYAYVNPIVAVALGASVLSEPITPSIMVGGSIIIAAVVAIIAGRTT